MKSISSEGRMAPDKRVISVCFLAVLLSLGSIAVFGCSKASPTGGGGAGPSETGAPGRGNGPTAANGASGSTGAPLPVFDPSKPEVIKRGSPDRAMVALTLDDGWNRDDRIFDLLRAQSVPATTFLIGGRGVAEGDPAWVKSLDDAGLEVATHTYDHYKLTDHPLEYIADDIKHGLDVIQSITGKRLPYMRPPGGFINEAVIQAAVENRCYVVMWTSELGDTANGVTVDSEVQSVLANLCNGDIILCHWGGHNTYEALSRLIPEIRARGYEFGTLTQVLAP